MNLIYPEKLKKKLKNHLDRCYILLGEDIIFLQKNEDLILQFAKKEGFFQKTSIILKKEIDWKEIFYFYQKKHLFFKKNILIVNIYLQKSNLAFINNINKIALLFQVNILIIFKMHKLSFFFLEKKNVKQFTCTNVLISCFTPNILNFKKWIEYEIHERKIILEQESLSLLYKNYEGNTLFINQILDVLSLTWPHTEITAKKIKTVISNFSIFYPEQWVNSIFNRNIEKSMYILNVFEKQKQNPLLLIRTMQKDLLKLLYMQRTKHLNISLFFQTNNIWNTRHKYFIHAYNYTCFEKCLKGIKILVQIEINIKKEYTQNVWLQLKTLTLILCS